MKGRPAFDDEFPGVVIQHPDSSPRRVRAHADYKAAKAGDLYAAARMVSEVLDQGKVDDIRTVIGDRKPIVVAVHAEEAAGRNKIPIAYAEALSEWLGLPLDEEIVQSNKPSRTAKSALYRIVHGSEFHGSVTVGRDYLLVDDHVSQGGTFADLRGYIARKGGHVIGATTLTGSDSGTTLAPTTVTLAALRKKFPGLEDWWKEQFGHDFRGVTEGEARYLLRHNAAQSIRDSIITARSER